MSSNFRPQWSAIDPAILGWEVDILSVCVAASMEHPDALSTRVRWVVGQFPGSRLPVQRADLQEKCVFAPTIASESATTRKISDSVNSPGLSSSNLSYEKG